MNEKILIVDDSRTEQFHIGEILKKNGYQVASAYDVADAMAQLESADLPALILMDVVMPGENGFHATRKITKDPRYKDIPVILCTSKDQQTDKIWGLRQGACDFLTKPVQSETLLKSVRHALGEQSA